MTYKELSKVAVEEWRAVEGPELARVTIGTGTCGRAAGAELVLASIRTALAELGIDARVDETGCLGLCYAEPLVELQNPGGPRILYGAVTDDKIQDLLRAFFCEDDLRPDLAQCVMNQRSVDGIPAFEDLPTRGLRYMPVIDAAGRLCGIIGRRDIVGYFIKTIDADTVS